MTTEQLATIQQVIEHLLQLMEVEAEVTLEVDSSKVVNVEIHGENLGILIGYHGETLSALQTVIGLVLHRQQEAENNDEWYKVLVNIGDYRQRQQEALEALSHRSAERVRFTRKPLALPAMSSYDRRIVHLALEREPDIASESEGEGRDRRLVVKIKEN